MSNVKIQTLYNLGALLADVDNKLHEDGKDWTDKDWNNHKG